MLFSFILIAGIADKLFAVLFPGAVAQTTTAQCLQSFAWMNNDRGQSPCLVAAYAQGACNGGQFSVNPIPPGSHYSGPTQAQLNPCQCSTVVYSLLSACGVCQNRTTETWSSWRFNCTQVSIQQFSPQIPNATSIPGWAYLDVVSSDDFSPQEAQADISAPASDPPGYTPTSTVLNTAPPFIPTSAGSGGSTGSASKKSNVGPIAGGVVGGLVGLGIIACIIVFLILRRRARISASRAYSATYTPQGNVSPNVHPAMSQQSYNDQQALRPYDPSDPSTYPKSPSPMNSTIQTTHSGPIPSMPQPPRPGQYTGIPQI